MNAPLLTIGVATLNRPKYLEIALKSIISASQFCECNIQLVVSDMGGNPESACAYERATHNAPSWLQCEWISDIRIPSGIANWDNCLKRARGQYFMMIGDDDRLLPEAINRLKEALDNCETELAGVLASACDIDESGVQLRTLKNPRHVRKGREFLVDVVTRKLQLRWCAFVAKTSILKNTRPFSWPFPGGGGAADGAAIISTALSGDILTLDVPISEFRVHGGNDSRAISLSYQHDQRQTLHQFVASLAQATSTDRGVVSVWLGAGIRYQCLRWAMQGLLENSEFKYLERLARVHLKHASGLQLPIRVRIYQFRSQIIGFFAFLITLTGFRSRHI